MAYEIIHGFKGSPDGFTVIEYIKGEIVELVEDLAKVALKEKWVKLDKTEEREAKARQKAEADARTKEEAEKEQQQRFAAITVIEGEIADLEAKLAKAADADKPAIQVELDVKQSEYAAL